MMTSDAEQPIGYGQRELILREIVENPGNGVMYYLCLAGSEDLLDRPERAFVSEELMLIPEHTELPPDYVQEW